MYVPETIRKCNYKTVRWRSVGTDGASSILATPYYGFGFIGIYVVIIKERIIWIYILDYKYIYDWINCKCFLFI